MQQDEWEKLTAEEKRVELYLRQKRMLAALLERGAISRAQYEKSLGGMTREMGMEHVSEAGER
jgi:hypothetical protein